MLQVDLFDDQRGAQVRHKAQHRYDQFVPNVRERIAPCAPMTRRTLCWAHFGRLYTPGSSLTEARFCRCNRLAVTLTPSFHVPPDLAVRDPYSRHQPVPLRSQGNRLRHSSRTGHHYYRHAAIVDDVVHRKADHGQRASTIDKVGPPARRTHKRLADEPVISPHRTERRLGEARLQLDGRSRFRHQRGREHAIRRSRRRAAWLLSRRPHRSQASLP